MQKIIMSGKHDKPPLSPSQCLFWDAGLSFWGMLAIWLCRGTERQEAVDYLLSRTSNPQSGLLAIGIVAAGSAMAFTFNIAVYYYILYTSALTSTVGSNGIKIFLICCKRAAPAAAPAAPRRPTRTRHTHAPTHDASRSHARRGGRDVCCRGGGGGASAVLARACARGCARQRACARA